MLPRRARGGLSCGCARKKGKEAYLWPKRVEGPFGQESGRSRGRRTSFCAEKERQGKSPLSDARAEGE